LQYFLNLLQQLEVFLKRRVNVFFCLGGDFEEDFAGGFEISLKMNWHSDSIKF
jgi:hypothetical protein